MTKDELIKELRAKVRVGSQINKEMYEIWMSTQIKLDEAKDKIHDLQHEQSHK